MRFRKFSEISVYNPWFSILASYGQELAPATASYGLAGPDLAWWADNSMRVRVRAYCSDYSLHVVQYSSAYNAIEFETLYAILILIAYKLRKYIEK